MPPLDRYGQKLCFDLGSYGREGLNSVSLWWAFLFTRFTKSKGCLSAFLWFHPWINRLKQIVRNRCCVMRRSNLSCICSIRRSSCLWGTEILVRQSSACNFQKGKIIPCQTDLTLKCRGQLRSVLLCINLCRVRIKCWMSHVCRIWFIWPWHLNP